MAEPITIAVAFGAAALFMVVAALTNADRRLRKKLLKAPHRSIKHLPDKQWVRFTGKVEALPAALSAPLTGRDCAAWLVVVEEKRGKSWSEVLRRSATQDFVIADGTGKLLVRVAGAQLALVRDGKFASGVLQDPTPELERFLKEHGQDSRGWVFNRALRYYEAVIEPGEAVAAGGFARAEPDPTPKAASGYRETPMRMVVQGSPDAPLVLSDDPRVTTPPR